MPSDYDTSLKLGLGKMTVLERVTLGLGIPGRAWLNARGRTVWLPTDVMSNADGTLRRRWFA